jgi:flagellar hook-basal body complex protein FliE
MINLNANISSVMPNTNSGAVGMSKDKAAGANSGFADTMDAIGKQISKVDDLQQSSDVSIQDLLSGKNEDITSVVSAVAKADMSFKLLVGVRNKLIEAYKQTMNMPL